MNQCYQKRQILTVLSEITKKIPLSFNEKNKNMLYFSVYLAFKFFVNYSFYWFLVCLTAILKFINLASNIKQILKYQWFKYLSLLKKKIWSFKITAPSIIYYCYLHRISFIVRFILFFHPITQTSFTAFETFQYSFWFLSDVIFVLLSLFYGFTYLYQMLNTIPHMDM
jgi:hypothetical protein